MTFFHNVLKLQLLASLFLKGGTLSNNDLTTSTYRLKYWSHHCHKMILFVLGVLLVYEGEIKELPKTKICKNQVKTRPFRN